MSLLVSSLRTLDRALRSRRLSTALLLIWLGLLLVWIVPFQIYGLPAAQLRNIIYREPFFAWVYAAISLTTVACVTLRLSDSWRRARRAPSVDARVRIGGSATELPGLWDPQRASGLLASAGFSRRVEGDAWVWGVRYRWSSLGTALSHSGIVLAIVLTAWWIAQPVPFEGSAIVAEGERFTGTPESYVETSGVGVPEVAFDLERVEPLFFEDILLFTQLDCTILEDSGASRRVAVGNPWYPDAGTQVALEDFGWTAEILGARDATTVVGPVVYKLQVFPPGSPDYVELGIGDARYRFKVTVFGDYVEREGQPGVASYNLRQPRIGLTCWRMLSNDQPLLVFADRVVETGEQIELSSRDSMAFLGIGTYGKFRVSRVFPFPLGIGVILTILLGFAMRLLFPRTEALIAPTDDARVELRVRAEVYGSSSAAQRIAAAWTGLRGGDR